MPLTAKEKTRRYRDKLKNNPEKYLEMKRKACIKAREKYHMKKIASITKEQKNDLRTQWRKQDKNIREPYSNVSGQPHSNLDVSVDNLKPHEQEKSQNDSLLKEIRSETATLSNKNAEQNIQRFTPNNRYFVPRLLKTECDVIAEANADNGSNTSDDFDEEISHNYIKNFSDLSDSDSKDIADPLRDVIIMNSDSGMGSSCNVTDNKEVTKLKTELLRYHMETAKLERKRLEQRMKADELESAMRLRAARLEVITAAQKFPTGNPALLYTEEEAVAQVYLSQFRQV